MTSRMVAPTVAVDSISAQMVTSTQSMRKPLPVGSGEDNGNGEGNGNVRKSQTPTVGSSGGGPVVTAPQCIECAERRMRVQSMGTRCKQLASCLAKEEEAQVQQEKELAERLAGAQKEHAENFAKLGALLAEQRKVGGQWKAEMVTLTENFERRLQEAGRRNKELKGKIAGLKVEVGEKEEALKESTELMEMYAGKLAKAEKNLEDEVNQEDESYIEITLPLPFTFM